ncbi:GSCOCG00013319001-RA-CDS [Cotesia congregata]|nr:GSCOCG00013319001-RA-CDS [Cotesia congregata]
MSKKPPAAKKQKTEIEPKKSRIVRSTSERIENYLKNNVGRKCWEKYIHNTIPGLNLNKKPWVQQWDFENAVNLYHPYPYTCDLPKPLLPPARTRRHIPRYVADLADIIECDPDPFFEGKYNWYYTGGSINNIYFNNKNLLIFPFMQDVVASPINLKDNSLWKPDLSKASKLTIGNPVYEVRHHVSSDNCRILVRCKHECVFYSLTSNDEGKLSLEALDNKENKSTPFISAALNPVDPNQFCTLNVGRIFEQCDMVSGKCLSKSLVNTRNPVPDSWGSIIYNSSPNIVALTDRNALHYMDLRVSLKVPTVSMYPQEMLNECDLVSLHMPSERPSRHYLGTYHHFLMVDDRSPDQCVHQKWTHQFRSPPLTGATSMCDGEEVIIISSQLPSEKSVIINTWQQFDDPHSYYLPHKL